MFIRTCHPNLESRNVGLETDETSQFNSNVTGCKVMCATNEWAVFLESEWKS